MSDQHCVIIGGSHAAAQLIASLRQEGWSGAITLVSDEPMLPYHRPPLSKAFLSGDTSEQELLIRPQQFYDQERVNVLFDTRAVAIDRERKQVVLDSGARLRYSKLVLATGARVRTLAIAGAALPGVFYLRQARDVLAIRRATAPGKRAVIIGGGYIGLEAAASLRQMGMKVTVLEALPRLLQRVTAPEVSAFYARVHREQGVDVITDASVQAIEGDDGVEAVVLADGRRLAADVVIIGVGVLPASELAEQAGLKVDNGVVVDEFATTSDPDIYAIGDCSSHYNPIYDCWLRLESVQNATDQARTAAQALCGKMIPYRALPWFWSDQYDLKLQIAGLSQGYDRVVLRGSASSGRSFSAFYFRSGTLIAVDAVNRPKDFMISKRFLADQRSADPERVADETIDLRDCFSLTGARE